MGKRINNGFLSVVLTVSVLFSVITTNANAFSESKNNVDLSSGK